jgi:hypothetical protein
MSATISDISNKIAAMIAVLIAAENKLIRKDADIREAVDMWCNPEKKAEALTKYGHISLWNTSSVTDMSWLFFGLSDIEFDSVQYMCKFNDDISGWDVSNVKSMYKMFQYARSFTQDISNWELLSDTSLSCMFDGCPISEDCKPERARDM